MEQLSGAGENWPVIDEIADANVVEQQDIVSCGIAGGEMLLKDREIYDVNQSRAIRLPQTTGEQPVKDR
ncbi:MAG: hypothetical protein GDA48_05135 [Hormoscilla sp. GM102CHS1]|nr:hypothetical protein [Hormoscilla sp. GM102CHS1]